MPQAGTANDNPERGAAVRRPSWWVRTLAALPFGVLYALSDVLAFLAGRVFPYRRELIDGHLAIAFPELDAPARLALARAYYAGFGDVLVEIVKAATITPEDLRRRVRIVNPGMLRDLLADGRPALLLAAHQCNWEWMLLSLALEFDVPVDAAYKPLKNDWAEREMLAIRSRFGSRLIPADGLIGDIIRQRKLLRAIALLADQEPRKSEQLRWVRFLNRDSAFFVGGEEIARTARYPALFARMRRVRRGHYEIEFEALAPTGERLAPGEFTDRYAALVEAQIRRAPADWPWSHKRWRLKKPLYGGQ